MEACKGACCLEGEEGAPLKKDEVTQIEKNLESILPYLDDESRKIAIDHTGVELSPGNWSTPLKQNGACIYSIKDSGGILHCAIEKSYKDGKSEFLKPISCHLYPIRVSQNEETDWEALNLHSWHICHAACNLGNELNVPVYAFLKTALVRKYGVEFYNELEEVAQEWQAQKGN